MNCVLLESKLGKRTILPVEMHRKVSNKTRLRYNKAAIQQGRPKFADT
jgi:hypothetical protein